jgi:hypothetical protein
MHKKQVEYRTLNTARKIFVPVFSFASSRAACLKPHHFTESAAMAG